MFELQPNPIMKGLIRKQSLLIAGFLAFTLSSFGAAGKYTIKGRVVDNDTKKPIEFASVVLMALPDSSIKSSALTDQKGGYTFNNVNDGSYIVKAQIVGYKPNISPSFKSTPNTVVADIPIASSAVIKEVTVTGKKPYIEKKADRTVLNIESSSTAAAESAYEVLKKAPNIEIDKDDNININGKQGVTVMINDRPTNLSGTDLANYLKSVQGSEIEKVEIINNPPSRYDAAGNTGIINIRTKRTFKPGFNGSINGGLSYNGKLGGNGGINLNLRNGKTNVYANYNPGIYRGENTIDLERIISYNNQQWLLDQRNKGYWKYRANSFKAGVDYDINKKNTIGFMVSGFANQSDQGVSGTTKFFTNKATADSSIYSSNPSDNTYRNMSYNLNYRSILDTTGKELNIDVDYAKFNNDSDANNDTYYYDALGSILRPAKLQRSESPSDITIKSAKADYVHPIGKMFKVEAGAKTSMVQTDNNLQYFTNINNAWSYDNKRSNHFVYDEDVLAGYLSLGFDKGKTSVKGGIRAEHTWSKGNSITENKVVTRSYTDLFPTFFIQQRINDKNSVGLSYNRRIDRPRYQQLNPFRFYLDEYTYMEGNPFLNPQYTNNISANYSWNNMLFSELTYTHTKDVMVEIVEQNDATKVGKQTIRNLNSMQGWSLTNSVNLGITKWWRSNNNLTAYYNSYKKTDNNFDQTNSKLSFNVSSNNSFILPKKFTFEVMGWFRSSQVYGMFRMNEMYAVNIGLQKTFLQDKARVKVSFDDVFGTMENRARANYDNINVRSHNSWSSQRVGVTFSYRFGKSDLKPSRQRRAGLEDESNRVGTGR